MTFILFQVFVGFRLLLLLCVLFILLVSL